MLILNKWFVLYSTLLTAILSHGSATPLPPTYTCTYTRTTKNHSYEDMMHVPISVQQRQIYSLKQQKSESQKQKMPKSISCELVFSDRGADPLLVLQTYINAECKVASKLEYWQQCWRGKIVLCTLLFGVWLKPSAVKWISSLSTEEIKRKQGLGERGGRLRERKKERASERERFSGKGLGIGSNK